MKEYLPEIRPFKASDWREYRAIRLRALQDSPDAFGSTYEESCKYPDEAWATRLNGASPETDYPMAAMMDSELVGLGWAKIEPPELDAAHLYQMWVDPNVRGHGVGEALVSAAIDWSRNQGALKLILEVTCGDRPARRLYDRIGFRPVGGPLPIREGSELLEQTMEMQLV